MAARYSTACIHEVEKITIVGNRVGMLSTSFESLSLWFDGLEVPIFGHPGLGQMMETACIDFLRDQRGIDVAVLRQTIADLGERQCLTASRHARRPRRNQVVV